MKKTLTAILVLVFCVSTGTSLVNLAGAQEIAREDVVFISDAWGPPSGWNPLLPDQSWGWNLQYESLYIYSTRDDVWIPWLAESYTWVDKLTLQVHIRPEATWWDGEPVTAQDVKYTFDLGQKYVIGWLSGYWDYLEEVKVVDDKTVQFITSEEKLNYFQLLGLLQSNDGVVIMPKHRWEALEDEMGEAVTQFVDDDPEKIVGSGCYKLLQWSEDVWYYQRVEDWWGKDIFGLPGPPYVAHITYKDNVAAILSFEQGECDGQGHFITSVNELWEIKGLPISTYYKHPPYYIGSGVNFLYVNYATYPLDQIAVRRAVSYAIPYEDLIGKAYFNYSVRASPSMIMHTIPAYTEWIDEDLVETYGYDLDLARAAEILEQSNITDRDGDGVREMLDGTKLGPYIIQVPYGWSDWMMMCDMISANLQEIGIDCQTEFPDYSVWMDRVFTGDFDFVICWDGGMGFDHPWNTFRWVMDARLTGPVGEVYPAGDWQRYMNLDALPLIDAVPKETDVAKLKQIYGDLQEMALTELPSIPLFYGAAWYEFSTEYWVGWPWEEDPRWLSPYPWNYVNNIPVYFGLSKASEGLKPMPDWATDFRIPTATIFEDLAAAPEPGVVTVTVTETVTETEVETVTSTATVPTMDVASVAGAGVVALIVGVVVGWLVASRKTT